MVWSPSVSAFQFKDHFCLLVCFWFLLANEIHLCVCVSILCVHLHCLYVYVHKILIIVNPLQRPTNRNKVFSE